MIISKIKIHIILLQFYFELRCCKAHSVLDQVWLYLQPWLVILSNNHNVIMVLSMNSIFFAFPNQTPLVLRHHCQGGFSIQLIAPLCSFAVFCSQSRTAVEPVSEDVGAQCIAVVQHTRKSVRYYIECRIRLGLCIKEQYLQWLQLLPITIGIRLKWK